MLRSLYSGVSGLQNHQKRMDVIGNNIANVNTIGFKSSRMTFQDAMSQTISYGMNPGGGIGGINPLQIGLGMQVGSIDTNFSQGALQTTNLSTDLALEGDGFFVISDGERNFYSRAGAFQLDANGSLTMQGGMNYVMGRLANNNGEIGSGASIEPIKLPLGEKSPAKATEEIKYHCNLDASADAQTNIWTAKWGSRAMTDGGVISGDSTATPPTTGYESVIAGNNFTIAIHGQSSENIVIPDSVTVSPKNDAELIAILNQAIRSNANLAGKVSAVANGGKSAKIIGSDINSLSSITNGDFTIDIGQGAETINLSGSPFNSVNDLVSSINQSISANNSLKGKVEAVSNYSGDGIMLKSIGKGSDLSITVNSGSLDIGLIGLVSGASASGSGGGIHFETMGYGGSDTSISVTGGSVLFDSNNLNMIVSNGSGTTSNTEINDLSITKSDLTPGDTIVISGVDSSGEEVENSFVYGEDGTTVADLLEIINQSFSGASAKINHKGELVLEDSVKGTSSSAISLSFNDNDGSSVSHALSSMAIPSFSLLQKGENAGEHTASIYAYDSLGKKHTIEITFSKNQGRDNYWNWEAIVDGGDQDILSGGKGYVSFNNDGSIAQMEASDGQKLSFSSGGGADTMSIELNGGKSGSFAGITQYDSPFTTIAYEQDGYTMGVLNNVYFDEAGVIYGEYTNGQTNKMAQLVLATFNNQGGLLKKGDSLYAESPNSGLAQIGVAGQKVSAKIRSGHLEGSNVDLSSELTDMIITQRGFQANTKVISTSDQMLQELILKIKR